jgi:hypothetical protein
MNWKVEPNGDKSIIDSLSNELKVDTIISSMLVRRGITNYKREDLLEKLKFDLYYN